MGALRGVFGGPDGFGNKNSWFFFSPVFFPDLEFDVSIYRK